MPTHDTFLFDGYTWGRPFRPTLTQAAALGVRYGEWVVQAESDTTGAGFLTYPPAEVLAAYRINPEEG